MPSSRSTPTQKFARPEDQEEWYVRPRNDGRRGCAGRLFKGRYSTWDTNLDARNREESAKVLEAWRSGTWPPRRERSAQPRIVDLAEKSSLLLSSEPFTPHIPKPCKDPETSIGRARTMDAVLRNCISTRATTASDEYDLEDEEFETSLFERKSAKAKTLSSRVLRNIDRASASGRKYSGHKVQLDDEDLFDPEKFRRIPLFVFVARRLDPNLFARMIYFFFQRKRWPLCSELPRQVHRFCKLLNITEDFKDMPAFAPEWVFHLQVMNNSLFWMVVRYFFRFSKFPSWEIIPSLYTNWFEKLELGEFEYPSITKFEKIPESVKKRYKILLECRLHLTEMQFPKGKDHFAMEISSKSTEEQLDCVSL